MKKTWIVRGVILACLVALGLAVRWLLAPRGLAWVVDVAGALVAVWLLVELVLQRRRRTGERDRRARWRAAIGDAAARPAAVRELRRELGRARRLGPRTRLRQARMAIALAELHEADGRTDEAVKVLAKVPVERLDPLPEAVVRLARAQAYLHRGDTEEASATIKPLGEGVDDPAVDAALRLTRATIAYLDGEVADAVDVARQVLAQAHPEDELWDEAKALEALVTDDPGLLDELSPAGRARLAAVSAPRIREWLGG